MVRSREGVCDTPLHFLADCVGWLVVVWFAWFAHVRAYALAPLQFLADCVGWLVLVGLCCSPT